MKYRAPRGTEDILPEKIGIWQFVEETCRKVFERYNYCEIRTPIFETTELFTRSIGESTDIVKKEMYTFPDRKGRSLTLRPEETAPVVRACLENNLIQPDQVIKLYYLGPMFRYERPQAGRRRQFHQAGVEAFGSADPMLDAELIEMCVSLFQNLGLKDLEVDLNSVGCKNCRPGFRTAIQKYFENYEKEMCQDCQERIQQNPLRILDCKEPPCQKYISKAPASVDYLCLECKKHFEKLTSWLEKIKVRFRINDRLVRGLDYYTRTTFEVVSKQLGAQNAVCGGGRYDDLVEELGGKPTPAIGFAAGLERIIEVIQAQKAVLIPSKPPFLFLALLGEEARNKGFELLVQFRKKGISADTDFMEKSLKGQMKTADRLGARFVCILGEEETKKKSIILRDMKNAVQEEVSLDRLFEVLEGRLKSEG